MGKVRRTFTPSGLRPPFSWSLRVTTGVAPRRSASVPAGLPGPPGGVRAGEAPARVLARATFRGRFSFSGSGMRRRK